MNSTGVKILIFFLLLSVLPLRAQSGFAERYLLRELDMEQGLPCSFVDDVLVDDAGFLWIATSGGGLCRFDGYDFLYFNVSTTPSLSSNFIRALVEDRHHRLWIASEGGLDVLDLHSLEKLDLGLEIPEWSHLCSFVAEDALGAVWAKFGTTLYRIAFDEKGKPQSVLPFSHPGFSDFNHVFKDVDRDGSVWTRLGGGFYKVSVSASGVLEAVRVAPTLNLNPETYVSDYLLTESSVWIATEDGLYRLHRSSGEWKEYVSNPSDPRTLTQNFVTSLSLTSDGLILASTLHGLNVYNPVTDTFERVGSSIINGVKTSSDRLLIGTENRGLRLAEPKNLSVKNITHVPGQESSLAGGAVNALWQDPDGRLWVGSVEGGLSILPPGAEAFRHLTREKGGLSHNSVSALRPGPGGVMYVGTWGGGLDVVSADDKPRVLYHVPDAAGRMDYVGVLEYDTRNDRLWIGSNRGIYLYNPSARTCVEVVSEGASGCIGSCIDRSGKLWVGCQEGYYVFDLTRPQEDGRFPYVHYPFRPDQPGNEVEEKICCVMESSEGEIWLGSNGGGIYRGVRGADDEYTFTNYSTRQGLSSDRVRGLCEDALGRIWASTEYGLNLLSPETGSITPFFQRDGLSSVQFHWNNACKGTDGLLYFGQSEGYSVLDPGRLPATLPAGGNLRFTKVTAGDQDIRNPFLQEVQMHENDRSLLLQFAVLKPDAAAYYTYNYRLTGYDPTWTRLFAGRREVSYSSLPAGRYTFEVEAFDRYRQSIGTLSLAVKVTPAFYHTWWFAVLVGLALLAGILLLVRARTRTLKRRQQMLEETVEQRTREISAQKKLVEEKVEELHRQNEVLLRQNEELASRKLLFSPERVGNREEEQFMEKALEELRQLYKDPNLDVARFCQAMGMSKTLLNTRLQESFGQSIGQFIRMYRLAVSREILESGSDMTVSEVAYEVGFNDPKYFTRCFAKEFGIPPSSMAK